MLLRKIRLENILSFGETQLELRPLNVIIGPNASGKSNLLRTIGLLQSLPKGPLDEILEKGGPRAWSNLIKNKSSPRIRILGEEAPFRYEITFRETAQTFDIVDEQYPGVFARRGGVAHLGMSQNVAPAGSEPANPASPPGGQLGVAPSQSILHRIRHPDEPKLSELATALENIRIYQDFTTGPDSRTRNGIESSAKADHLSRYGNNLALVLNEIGLRHTLDEVSKNLRRFCPLFEDIRVLTRGGITQFYLKEKNISDPLAATSLSDGTLRLICLLAILLDPDPPNLICIEEPETGMHPDSIRMIADLLKDASNRTQLIVTTHSPTLIDALSDQPEAVVVCERNLQGFTEFRRLTDSDLSDWLDRYSLGQLWVKGEIGGNRW